MARSAPQPMASIGDWHALVTPVLDELGIARYGVWGISAGAPYSYALAALDHDRVDSVAITSGLGYLPDPEILSAYGADSQKAFDMFRTGSVDAVREYWSHTLRAALDRQPPDGEWAQILRDSLANDCAGPAREALLQQRPWGFDLSGVVSPVRMWHSRDDAMVPVATADLTAGWLSHADLTVLAGTDHVPTVGVVRQALDFLAPAPL
ncbi:alpha/beta fold hydrolase [Rhodococcus triatomae]|nr:hydrolase or acyltransferase of alpha/beta superfamily protein [Rhodococcus triatomae BKS 15-14]